MTDNLVYIANSAPPTTALPSPSWTMTRARSTWLQHVTEISECHYLNLHPNGKLLLATTMDGAVEVVSFAIDAEGKLRKVSSAPAAGTSPAYVCADASGDSTCCWSIMLTTGRNAATSASIPLTATGRLGRLQRAYRN